MLCNVKMYQAGKKEEDEKQNKIRIFKNMFSKSKLVKTGKNCACKCLKIPTTFPTKYINILTFKIFDK